MQVLLMHTPEATQVGADCRACSLTGVAMDLTEAIPIGIPRPLVYAVADGGMGRMATTIALPLVGIESCATGRHVVGNEVVAGPRVRVITHPEAVLTCLPRYQTNNGWAIVGISAMPFALIRASTWRVGGGRGSGG